MRNNGRNVDVESGTFAAFQVRGSTYAKEGNTRMSCGFNKVFLKKYGIYIHIKNNERKKMMSMKLRKGRLTIQHQGVVLAEVRFERFKRNHFVLQGCE